MTIRNMIMSSTNSAGLPVVEVEAMLEQTRLQASDAAASDLFGNSVAISSDGNTLAVGSQSDDNSAGGDAGSVYIFTRSGTTWTEQTRLQASDAAASDFFGNSVAISSDGNTLAVGSSYDDNAHGSNAGSVYIFTRSGTTWTQQTRLQASDGTAVDQFGTSVAVSSDGNTLVVSAYADLTYSGSVYIFTRSGTTWTQQTRLRASDAAASDYFGWSVDISADGNTAVIGSYGDDNSGGTDAGSVYIFTRSGTAWTEQTRLQASDAVGSDRFGILVTLSLDGNTLAVGSAYDDNSGGTDAGSVYIFTRSGTAWTEQTRLQASDAASAAQFGRFAKISSDGNVLVIGAFQATAAGNTGAGAAYIFTRSGTTWTEQTRLQASDAAASDYFGNPVAISSDGNTVVVGSHFDDNSGGLNAGSVYVFTADAPMESSPAWSNNMMMFASDAAADDQFGHSTAISADGNTFAVGARLDDNSGGANAGSTYIFTKSGTAWTEQTRLQASDASGIDQFGCSVALSSDGNTAAVGALGDDNSGGVDAGSVYVFTRSGTTWTEQTRLQASDADASDNFGYSIALSADGNTLIASSRFDNNSAGVDAGSAYIFTRSGTAWTEQTKLLAGDAAANDMFGYSTAISADGNTVAIGSYLDDNSSGTDAGSVYIFTRSGTTWTEQTRLQASDAAGSGQFGYSVALSADGNTVAAGAAGNDNSGGTDAGAAYIFTRSGTAWTEQTKLLAGDAAANDWFGYSVALAADGNTLAVGSFYDDTAAGANAGSVYIFTRSGTTWTEQNRLAASDAGASDGFGGSVALSADGNTLVAASRLYDCTYSNQGSISIFRR